MELTGKAKEAFEKWLDNYSQKHHQKEWLDNDLYLDEVYLPDELMNALIIEWLDSVGIITEVIATYYDGWTFLPLVYDNFANKHDIDVDYDSRQQATEKAIERAVELFNERSER